MSLLYSHWLWFIMLSLCILLACMHSYWVCVGLVTRGLHYLLFRLYILTFIFGLSTIILFAKCFNVTKWQSAFCWMPFPVSHTPGHFGIRETIMKPREMCLAWIKATCHHLKAAYFILENNIFQATKQMLHKPVWREKQLSCTQSFVLLLFAWKANILRNTGTAKLNTHYYYLFCLRTKHMSTTHYANWHWSSVLCWVLREVCDDKKDSI